MTRANTNGPTTTARPTGEPGMSLLIALVWGPVAFALTVVYGFWEIGPDSGLGWALLRLAGIVIYLPFVLGVVRGWRIARNGRLLGWLGLILNSALLALGVYFVLSLVVPGMLAEA